MITAFLIAMMALAVFPLAAQASTGNIYINAASPGPSAVGQQVAAGGSVDLDFGGVTWSGAQFYLMMSTDGFSQVSTGDSRYSPLFDVTNLTSTATSTYTYMGQSWTVGNGHVIGPIQKNLAGGNYWIKAFDGATTSVAVTDTYITITPAFFVAPLTGVPNTEVTLSGFAFKANALVNISYSYFGNPGSFISIANLVQANASGIFEYTFNAPDLKQALAAGDTPIAAIEVYFRATDNATGTTYDAPTFNQGLRGLLQVKRTGMPVSEQLPSSGNMFGNGTDFTATGSFPITNVGVNSNVMIAGNNFFPGNFSLKWDNTALLSVATVNATGFFNTTVTVPITPTGNHNITMIDQNGQIFVIFLTVVPSVTLSPTSGPVGTIVTATGYGFPATIGTTAVNASIAWPGVSAYVGSAITDASGSFVATFVVPQSAGGLNILEVFQNASGSMVSTATPSFTVTASFVVSPSSFANNATLMVVASGNGFKPGCDYTVNIDNNMLGFDYKAWGYQTGIMPNATGFLSVTFIGAGFSPGVHVVTLYENASSGVSNAGKIAPAAYAQFTVLGTGDPTIDAISSLNTTIAGTLTSISGTIATLQTSMGTVQSSVSSLGASISSVNSGIATITSNVGSISTQLSNLNAAIVAVQGDIATVSTSLGTITTSLASLDTKITSIQGSIATVQTSIGTLQGTVTSINDGVATVKTGVGTLQTSVGSIQTDVVSTKDTTSGMSTLIYVGIAFALIAAIAAIASILLMRKKIAS